MRINLFVSQVAPHRSLSLLICVTIAGLEPYSGPLNTQELACTPTEASVTTHSLLDFNLSVTEVRNCQMEGPRKKIGLSPARTVTKSPRGVACNLTSIDASFHPLHFTTHRNLTASLFYCINVPRLFRETVHSDTLSAVYLTTRARPETSERRNFPHLRSRK